MVGECEEGNHINARSWSNAGWKIERLVEGEWVKLIRVE